MDERQDPVKESDQNLRSYLAERDVPCPGCGYNLRGLPGSTCPECRQELKLTVGLVESRIGALVACLGPLFAGAGAAGCLLSVVVLIVVGKGRGMPRDDEAVMLIWLPLGCLTTCGLVAAVLCMRRGRVWFRSQSRGTRMRVVVGSVALPLAWFAVFLGFLFWGV